MSAPGDEVINDIQINSGWHLLADDTFQGGHRGTGQPAGQVEALLNKALATLSLPAALFQSISARLLQAVTHICQAILSAPVTIRVYIQKPDDRASCPQGNGWGFFLVERSANHPGNPTEAPDYLIEIYLYSEGEAR